MKKLLLLLSIIIMSALEGLISVDILKSIPINEHPLLDGT